MDGTGDVSGAMGRIRRALAFTLMDQLVDFAWYEWALRDGRAVVMVRVRGDAPKAHARAVLERHGAHFVNYYGRFATEEIVTLARAGARRRRDPQALAGHVASDASGPTCAILPGTDPPPTSRDPCSIASSAPTRRRRPPRPRRP